MIYSTGCEYAIRALIRLAQQAPTGALCRLQDFVNNDNMPEQFVGKLLQMLVRADLLVSSRGRGGGFALRMLPREMALRQIVEAIDGKDRTRRCILGLSACDENQACPQHEGWVSIRRQIDELLDKTTLADLVDAMAKKQSKLNRRR